MKSKGILLLAWLLLGFWTSPKLAAWGFWAHQRINRMAVFTLPPEMLGLYKKNIDYLTEHATDPDSRRYAVEGEAERHFIDLDRYGKAPYENVPRFWKDAVALFTEDSLRAHGIVPWHVYHEFYNLVDAFKEKNLRRIMKTSADFGHYIADSHVPLHTTHNYNGQLSGQKGIHGLWESRLPEVFGEGYNYFIGPAYYIAKPQEEAWKTVLESNACLDSVFEYERKCSQAVPVDRKYSFESRGEVLTRVYSLEFSKMYHQMLAGQVERRLRTAIQRIGAFWFSAWVVAGQPDLTGLEGLDMDDEPEKFDKKLKVEDRENQEAWNGLPSPPIGQGCGHEMCEKEDPVAYYFLTEGRFRR